MDSINIDLIIGIDKQMHFFGFLIISFLIGIMVLTLTPIGYSRRNLSLVWFFLILIGIIEEYRQFSDPDRSTEFLDGIANIMGVSCGLLLPFLLVSFYKQKGRTRGLIVLYVTLIIVLSIGLWEMNQRPFL
ncbi:VanZ family protein [Bacillus sp. DJP31]|uniref:VanZ family protein n=1 Tax=Bacillus sp. DJP31 TaxID=3409789 RepID=UPI003BB5DD7A